MNNSDPVRDAVRRALGLKDTEPRHKKHHPGAHFLYGGLAFFTQYPLNRGNAQLGYTGAPFSRDDCKDHMQGQGYACTSTAPAADTYTKDDAPTVSVAMDGGDMSGMSVDASGA